MSTKTMIYIGASAGSLLGGYVPLLWGGESFSTAGLIFSAVGGFVGIYVAYKVSQSF